MAFILQKLQTSQEVDHVYRFISALGHITVIGAHSKFMLQLLRVDSADTSTFVTGKSPTETEMRPEENSHARGSCEKQTKDYSKVASSVYLWVIKTRFRTAGMIIICVQNTSLIWPQRVCERNPERTWNIERLWTNLLMFWSKMCCWYKKTWHWALPLHQF